MKLLMNFIGVQQVNLSYFLYKSLVKMAEKVQSQGEKHHSSSSHHGLVKVLVCHKLSQENVSWDHFAKLTFPSSSSTRFHDKTMSTVSPMQQEIASSRRSAKRKDRSEGS